MFSRSFLPFVSFFWVPLCLINCSPLCIHACNKPPALNRTIIFHIFLLSKMIVKCNPAFQSGDPPSKLKMSVSCSLLSKILGSTGFRTDSCQIPLATFFHFVNKQMISSCQVAFSNQLHTDLRAVSPALQCFCSYANVMSDSVKSLIKVMICDIHCSSPIHEACYPVTERN